MANEKTPKTKPAMTPEAREQQLIAMAVDSVEERIRTGKATSQELVHFLKLGTTKAKMEMEMMEEQKKLLQAKTEMIESAKAQEELYKEAIKAMQIYSGNGGGLSDD